MKVSLAALALLLAGPARAEDRAPDDAIFQDAAYLLGLSGTGWITVAGQAPIPLDNCVVVPLGATVCTAENSYATIRLSPDPNDDDADDVVLLPATCLNIEEAKAGRTQLAMSQGAIAVAEDSDGRGELAIRTRDGLAQGLAGGFRITLEGAATRTEAVSGPVLLRGDGGELELAPGTGSRLRQGEAPDEAEQLLRPESLLLPEDGAALRRPDFTWEPVPYATGYRVELAANAEFTDVIEAIDVPQARWEPDLLFVPIQVPGLWWRVSAYDRFGFLGVPTPSRPLALPAGVGG